MKKSKDEREAQRSKIINSIGLGLAVVSYIGAMLNMLNTKREESWSDRKVIRICHWQLESGFREGMDHAIKEFEKLYPDVKIIQLPIYQRAYQQFMKTQLIGGTAPDIMELPYGVGSTMRSRYFIPLSRHLEEPNKYNEGTSLEGVRWIDTFKDGLVFAIKTDQADYFSVNMNLHTFRLYYNKTLLKKITGSAPPSTFTGLLDLCRKVDEYSRPMDDSERIYPIAGSQKMAELGRDAFNKPFLVKYVTEVLPMNYDLRPSTHEKYLGYLYNKYSFNDPKAKAAEEVHRLVAQYYQPGFMAVDRQEASFLFMQQRALMFAGGSWDYTSMKLQAQDNGFEIGVMDFPIPTKDHPRFGEYVDGQVAEATRTDGGFGIARNSKNQDVALEFLRFLTSKRTNEEVNRIINWLPSIRNTEVLPELRPFLSRTEGLPELWLPLTAIDGRGTRTYTTDMQNYWEYVSGDIDYAEFARRIEKSFIPEGAYDLYHRSKRSFEMKRSDMFGRSVAESQVLFARDMNREQALRRLRISAFTYGISARNRTEFGHEVYKLSQKDSERINRFKRTRGYRQIVDLYNFKSLK